MPSQAWRFTPGRRWPRKAARVVPGTSSTTALRTVSMAGPCLLPTVATRSLSSLAASGHLPAQMQPGIGLFWSLVVTVRTGFSGGKRGHRRDRSRLTAPPPLRSFREPRKTGRPSPQRPSNHGGSCRRGNTNRNPTRATTVRNHSTHLSNVYNLGPQQRAARRPQRRPVVDVEAVPGCAACWPTDLPFFLDPLVRHRMRSSAAPTRDEHPHHRPGAAVSGGAISFPACGFLVRKRKSSYDGSAG
jgi:hypothetical protein